MTKMLRLNESACKIIKKTILWSTIVTMIFCCRIDIVNAWDKIHKLQEQNRILEDRVRILHWQTRNLQQNKTGLIFQWLDYED